jgi:hypothetical protein
MMSRDLWYRSRDVSRSNDLDFGRIVLTLSQKPRKDGKPNVSDIGRCPRIQPFCHPERSEGPMHIPASCTDPSQQ